MVSNSLLITLIVGFITLGVTAIITKNRWALAGCTFLAGLLVMDIVIELYGISQAVDHTTIRGKNVLEDDTLKQIHRHTRASSILPPTHINLKGSLTVLEEKVIITYKGRVGGGCSATKGFRFTICPTDSGVIDTLIHMGRQVVFYYSGECYQLNLLGMETVARVKISVATLNTQKPRFEVENPRDVDFKSEL